VTEIGTPFGARPQLWTGALRLGLANGRQWVTEGVSVDLSLSHANLRRHDRSLAVIDRDELRRWLHQPGGDQLAVDDVTLARNHGSTSLTVRTSAFFTVDPDSVENLLRVV
jgi:hypothetical protein